MLPDLDLVQDFYVVADKGGAANYLPPFSLAGADLAMKMGAQYVMPDACLTKDEIAVVLPDCKIHKDYTNIMDTGLWDNINCEKDYCAPWMFNFTDLQEIKLKQPKEFERSTEFDDLFSIPTLNEYLGLVNIHNELPDNEKVGVMLKLTTHHLMQDGYFVEYFYQLLKNIFGEEIVDIPNVPDLGSKSRVQPLVIVSEDRRVLNLMRQKTKLPLVWLYTSLDYPGLNAILDMMLEMSETIQGWAPPASLLIGIPHSDAIFINRTMSDYGMSMLPHTRGSSLVDEGRISESENYFLACCVKVDNMISDYVDELLNITCDRVINDYTGGLSAWCDLWEQ